MQPFASAPRTLVALLSAAVVLLLLHALLFSPSLLGLLWPALVTALSLSALFGSKRALASLKYLFYFIGIVSLLALLFGPLSILAGLQAVLVAAMLIATARYIAKSKEVAHFYASQPNHTPGEG